MYCTERIGRVKMPANSPTKKEIKDKPLENEVRFVLKIRVYGEGHKTHDSHGYLLDDLPMGVSAPITEMVVNIRELSLHTLRPMLMYDNRNNMKKRSALWQEVLFIMDRLPNVYNRPKLETKKFRFGFVRKSRLQDITLVATEAEKRPIADLIGATEYFNHDLVIVPITQIPDDPTPGNSGGPEAAAAMDQEKELMKESTAGTEDSGTPSNASPQVVKKKKKRKKIVTSTD